MKKQILSFFVVMCLIASPLALASQEPTYPISVDDQNYTLNIMMPRSLTYRPMDETWIATRIRELCDFKIQFVEINPESYTEKKNLVLASNDMPDIVVSLTNSEVTTYALQGVLSPLNGLIEEYAYNFKQLTEKNPTIIGNITLPDGNIYAMPTLEDPCHPREYVIGRSYINNSWLTALDLTPPKTLDEFYDVMVAFRDKDPNGNGVADEIPLSGYWGSKYLSPQIGILTAFGLLEDRLSWDDSKTMVFYVPTDARYKSYLEFMHRLYAEKLMDQEIFTQTEAQWRAKGSESLYGYFFDWAAFVMVSGAYDQYTGLAPMTSALNDKQVWPFNHGITPGVTAITSSCTKPQAAVELLDYFYSWQGSVEMVFGPEVGKTGNEELFGEGSYYYDENGNALDAWPDSYSSWETYCVDALTPRMLGFAVNSFWPTQKRADDQNHLTNNLVTYTVPYGSTVLPSLYYTSEEQDRISILEADIKQYTDKMEAQFITGEVDFEEGWDTFQKTLENMGITEYVAIAQASLNRWNGK